MHPEEEVASGAEEEVAGAEEVAAEAAAPNADNRSLLGRSRNRNRNSPRAKRRAGSRRRHRTSARMPRTPREIDDGPDGGAEGAPVAETMPARTSVAAVRRSRARGAGRRRRRRRLRARSRRWRSLPTPWMARPAIRSMEMANNDNNNRNNVIKRRGRMAKGIITIIQATIPKQRISIPKMVHSPHSNNNLPMARKRRRNEIEKTAIEKRTINLNRGKNSYPRVWRIPSRCNR
mmetsp:Transcript_1413/g.2585  ORF Transcript_1413/g.2585 Transcript_1413/m.2585 type:complete len:233 (+) Transcript_1413:93-791(+)